MSLSQFSFAANTIIGLHSWFIDIMNHLSAKNYDNGTWIPTITGMAGDPTVTAWYQRFGIECSFIVTIDGTHTMNDAAEMTLPVSPAGVGVVTVHSQTDNYSVGTSHIDVSSLTAKLPEYSLTDQIVIVQGKYRVSGI